jgi:transcriptional regulator with XRE-family HTH domain
MALLGLSDGARLLREVLALQGWSQNELARQLGTSSGLVSRWLSGRRTPGLVWAIAIARLTGVPASAWTSDRLAA